MQEALGTPEAFGVQQGSPTEKTVPREVVTGGVRGELGYTGSRPASTWALQKDRES